MKLVTLLLILLITLQSPHVKDKSLPAWFLKSFNKQGLNKNYILLNSITPSFLEADFNGDNKNDIAVQIRNIKTKKKGILIINANQNRYYIFGAGNKFFKEKFDNTDWLSGWNIYKKRIAYDSQFNSDGDEIGSKNIVLKHPAIYIYAIEDGDDYAGQLLYWDGYKYISIHQGE